jgi:hypothetical protein
MERDFLSAWFVAMMELAHDAGDRNLGADEITTSRSAASFTIARIQTNNAQQRKGPVTRASLALPGCDSNAQPSG